MSGMLMDERFVAVFPSLVRLLGSLEQAVVLQHIHWTADERGDCKITAAALSAETGITERTIRRAVDRLREAGFLVSRRASSHDATLVYSINHDQLALAKADFDAEDVTEGVAAPVALPVQRGATRPGQSGHLGVSTLATSEVATLANSSTQKEEVPREGWSDTEAHDRDRVPPLQHPSRQILQSWRPRPDFAHYLVERYPHVNVGFTITRFVNHYFAKQQTSKSWEALLENWCINDEERFIAAEGGTDELGRPRDQRGSSIVPPPLRPGDPGYFNPTD